MHAVDKYTQKWVESQSRVDSKVDFMHRLVAGTDPIKSFETGSSVGRNASAWARDIPRRNSPARDAILSKCPL
jgi:hypothetical protein